MGDGINWGILPERPASNVLNSIQKGYEYGQGLQDRRAQQEAGQYLAKGDYSGASNVLYNRGLLDPGAQVQRMGQDQEKLAKAEEVETHKFVLNSAEAVRYNFKTPEERRAYYQTSIRPALEARGMADSRDGQLMLQRFDNSTWADADLDTFIQTYGGELQRPEFDVMATGGGELVGYNKQDPFAEGGTRVLRERPQATGEWVSEGGNWWWVEPGKPPQMGPKLTAAPKTFAPQRPRSGGGGSPAAAGGGGPAPWERDW